MRNGLAPVDRDTSHTHAAITGNYICYSCLMGGCHLTPRKRKGSSGSPPKASVRSRRDGVIDQSSLGGWQLRTGGGRPILASAHDLLLHGAVGSLIGQAVNLAIHHPEPWERMR